MSSRAISARFSVKGLQAIDEDWKAACYALVNAETVLNAVEKLVAEHAFNGLVKELRQVREKALRDFLDLTEERGQKTWHLWRHGEISAERIGGVKCEHAGVFKEYEAADATYYRRWRSRHMRNEDPIEWAVAGARHDSALRQLSLALGLVPVYVPQSKDDISPWDLLADGEVGATVQKIG